MLIIDLTNKRVNNAPIDPDVVVIKGASSELVRSLTRLTLTSDVQVIEPKTSKVPLAGIERPYVEKISKAIPQSVYANCGPSFDELFTQLGKIVSAGCNCTDECKGDKVFKKTNKTRAKLQGEIATALVSDSKFIEALRKEVQNSATLNKEMNLPTTNNVKAAVALYAYFGDDRSFSSTIGSKTIAKEAVASPDTISRLASDFAILRRIGASTATRYFVTKSFGNLLIRVLDNSKFDTLLQEVDGLQDQLDTLGSLK